MENKQIKFKLINKKAFHIETTMWIHAFFVCDTTQEAIDQARSIWEIKTVDTYSFINKIYIKE